MLVTPTPTPSPSPVPSVVEGALTLGSVPEWVAAAVALLALIAAGISLRFTARAAQLSAEANSITAAAYRDDVKVRTEAQARRVWPTLDAVYTCDAGGYVLPPDNFRSHGGEVGIVQDMRGDVVIGWNAAADQTQVHLTVHNESDEVVGPIRAYVCDRETLKLDDRVVIDMTDPLLPGEKAAMCLIRRESPKRPLSPVIEFRDAAGVWWRRRHYEPVEQLGTEDPRGWTSRAVSAGTV